MSRPLLVVAVGGNALIRDPGHQGIPDQAEVVEGVAEALAPLTERFDLIVTHGNGPQVGFILRRSELAAASVPRVPMEYATADTQGAIGWMFARAFANAFHRRGLTRRALAMVTQVEVDPADPAFQRPDKPVGSAYSAEEAARLAQELGWTVGEDSGRGWRRLVPSPKPKRVLEADQIGRLAQDGHVVIACGGGGVPVTRDAQGLWHGCEGVIDKDRSSALLAASLGASALVLATGVDQVCLNWGQPNQRGLDRLSPAEARTWLAAGEFGAGSMAPKVEALLEFAAAGGRGLITRQDRILDAWEGRTGTWLDP